MQKKVNINAKKLIKVLLDKDQEFGDRDDVAMDLSLCYADEFVINALVHVINDDTEDADLVDRCLETFSEIICEESNSNLRSTIVLKCLKRKELKEYLSTMCPSINLNDLLKP